MTHNNVENEAEGQQLIPGIGNGLEHLSFTTDHHSCKGKELSMKLVMAINFDMVSNDIKKDLKNNVHGGTKLPMDDMKDSRRLDMEG